MDYGALPPEINSARMYSGPGSPPMLAAAAAWDGLAAELSSTASSYQSVIERLSGEGWLGPASASMAAAVTPYMTWVSLTGAQAEQAATQASAAAAAYEAAFAATVPPAAVAANRVQLATLVATNFLGQNTPAIAATEAHYGEMWAQDAAAMYAYAASSAAASVLKLFGQPPQTTNPAGQADQTAAVAQATATPAASGAQTVLSQLTSAVPNALQSLAAPLGLPTDLWSFLDSNFVNGFVSAGYTTPPSSNRQSQERWPTSMRCRSRTGGTARHPAAGQHPRERELGDAHVSQRWFGAHAAGYGLGGFGLDGSRRVRWTLSVPQSWVAATQVENHAGAALAGGGWNSTAAPGYCGRCPECRGFPPRARPDATSAADRDMGSR